MIRPTAIINLNSLRQNIKYIKSILNKKTDIMPVVKANAYGHGLFQVAKILKSEGIKYVSVATIDEVEEVLKLNLGFTILHLGKCSKKHTDLYSNKNVIGTINTINDVDFFAKQKNKKFNFHVKVNTGMNRMGCDPDELDSILSLAEKKSNINIQGIYSHLACSENKNKGHNQIQFDIFNLIVEKYKYKYLFHILNSGGMINFKNHHMDFVRTGIAIYGICPKGMESINLKPVMKFSAPVVLIKNVKKEEKIGYGCTYICKKNMKIGIVQCGYADGVPLFFDNKGFVFYKKNKVSILGRISMDLTCIDLTEINSIKEGDSITFWGDPDIDESSLEYISKEFDSMPYIFLTSISNRVERIYIEK